MDVRGRKNLRKESMCWNTTYIPMKLMANVSVHLIYKLSDMSQFITVRGCVHEMNC
jgi:hypothetical protein